MLNKHKGGQKRMGKLNNQQKEGRKQKKVLTLGFIMKEQHTMQSSFRRNLRGAQLNMERSGV